MTDPHPSETSDPLQPVLRRWTVNQPLPPRFETRVWQRIRAAETRATPVYARVAEWLETMFARPAWAVAYIAILLVISLSLGDWQGHARITRAEDAARALYVQAVDPYQTPRP